ncbi:dual-specificity RNA methyltransferase RlmN [Deferribacterales bacterium]|nr:dual-specificity RNA methyltransferase RlmN [Deferribacterales bacterium]
MLVVSLGESKYRAGQLFRWLYHERATNINSMSNISKTFRELLADNARILQLKELASVSSKIDGTTKVLFELEDGERIEAVVLPARGSLTACISSQVGCKMGCRFCATARIGYKRNLHTAEILEQLRQLEVLARAKFNGNLTNIVFMGMGEPLDNYNNVLKAINIMLDDNGYGYSHRRITLSSAGLAPKIKLMLDDGCNVNLAVSINAPDDDTRRAIMPINNKYNLAELMETLKGLDLQRRKRITIEYVMLGGLNDTAEHARSLMTLLRGLPVKINLIRYNGGGDANLKPPKEEDVLAFQSILTSHKYTTFIRKSLGADIFGACGQLAAGYYANTR